MRRSGNPYEPLTRAERRTAELLVRLAIGVGTGLLGVFATPLLLGVFSPWWFVVFGGVGFLIGFIGGDAIQDCGRRRRRTASGRD